MLFLLACRAAVVPSGSAVTGWDDPRDTAADPVEDVGGDSAEDSGTEIDDPTACNKLYDADLFPRFELTISDETWAAFGEDYASWEARLAAGEEVKPWHPLDAFRYEDEVVTDAQIRLKGNPCCSWVGNKYQWVIAFNETDRTGRFHGLREISLDQPYYEPSFLRERTALAWNRDLGLPASCANNAEVWVNGALFGLYTNIETVDKEFLQRNFGDAGAEGNLYKYDWTMQAWEQKTGDGDFSDLTAFFDTYDAEEQEELWDLDEAMLEWAAEAAAPDWDGYWSGSINFMLYHHPDRGWMMIPWDQDYAFFVGTDMLPAWRQDYYGLTLHLDVVLADATLRDRYLSAFKEVIGAYDVATFESRVDEWTAQVDDVARADPNKGFTDAQYVASRNELRAFFATRQAFLSNWADRH